MELGGSCCYRGLWLVPDGTSHASQPLVNPPNLGSPTLRLQRGVTPFTFITKRLRRKRWWSHQILFETLNYLRRALKPYQLDLEQLAFHFLGMIKKVRVVMGKPIDCLLLRHNTNLYTKILQSVANARLSWDKHDDWLSSWNKKKNRFLTLLNGSLPSKLLPYFHVCWTR